MQWWRTGSVMLAIITGCFLCSAWTLLEVRIAVSSLHCYKTGNYYKEARFCAVKVHAFIVSLYV